MTVMNPISSSDPSDELVENIRSALQAFGIEFRVDIRHMLARIPDDLLRAELDRREKAR